MYNPIKTPGQNPTLLYNMYSIISNRLYLEISQSEIIVDIMHNNPRISPNIIQNYASVYYTCWQYIACLCARMSLLAVYNQR